jgi:hypothetical protein
MSAPYQDAVIASSFVIRHFQREITLSPWQNKRIYIS